MLGATSVDAPGQCRELRSLLRAKFRLARARHGSALLIQLTTLAALKLISQRLNARGVGVLALLREYELARAPLYEFA